MCSKERKPESGENLEPRKLRWSQSEEGLGQKEEELIRKG
jgi:hypothetical protein